MQDIGLVGLAVMGRNLALNIEEKGFSIAVHNRSPDKIDALMATAPGKRVMGCRSPVDFIRSIERPRRIILMVKAGKPVEDTIATLKPLLDEGDLLVDGGNELFSITEARAVEMMRSGLRYIGMGVSGGETGARHGPSLMPGGQRNAYDELAPILSKIAAQVDDGPCVDYMGPGGSGHYVKMVHNGIEYGDMQLISEAYDILRTVGGLENDQLANVFADWDRGELKSFLIEITAQIIAKKDERGHHLIDSILDKIGQKGTGRWTVQQACELAAPVPTIAGAVEARALSALKEERVAASRTLKGVTISNGSYDRELLVEDVRHALYASKVCSYAQGMNLLRSASKMYEWELRLGRIARIWKGGCIIKARFLDRIKQAYERDPDLPNLLVDAEFAQDLVERQPGWRRIVARAAEAGIPIPTMSASLSYFDAYRRERLPANLVQAQRDFFGSHTYERIDRPGAFHMQWTT
jgi:6-phosphogluconate dehydrogenase